MERIQRKSYKKKKLRKRVFWFVIFPILLIAGVSVSYGAHLLKKAANVVNGSYDENIGKSDLREKKVDPKVDNFSILFIGIDDSESRKYGEDGANSRSDALMVATLNDKDKSIKLVSIPRDTYVYIDDVGYKTRINHAHAYGGPKSTIKAVENLLEIPIDYYVRMDFYAFMDVVDALGGIELDVPYAISEKNADDVNHAINLQPGLQELNGEEALAFARTRKKDNDIERGKRQQEIMKALLKKSASASSVLKYGKVIDAFGSHMKTNMTFDEMTTLVDYGISRSFDIETLSVSGSDTYINKAYYWLLDEDALEELKAKLKAHIGI